MKRFFFSFLLILPLISACAPTPGISEPSDDIKDLGIESAIEELDLVEE